MYYYIFEEEFMDSKKILFLDANFLRDHSGKEKEFQESLKILSEKWEVYISSFTAIELKNNKTDAGLETLRFLEYVKVLPSQMEFMENIYEAEKLFSKEELLKTDNTEQYIKYKKYIEIKDIKYVFSVIELIINECRREEINYNMNNWSRFAEEYLKLNERKEEINLIKNFCLGLKEYMVEDENLKNAKKKVYLMKIEQFFSYHKGLLNKEKTLYIIGFLRIVEKILSNKEIGNKSIGKRKNDFFDLGFLSTLYLNSDILTKDNNMIKEYKKMGYEEVERFNDYIILRPHNTKTKTYEEIYEEIINLNE